MNDFTKKNFGFDLNIQKLFIIILSVLSGLMIIGLFVPEPTYEEQLEHARQYKKQYEEYPHDIFQSDKMNSAAVAPLLTGNMQSQYQLMYQAITESLYERKIILGNLLTYRAILTVESIREIQSCHDGFAKAYTHSTDLFDSFQTNFLKASIAHGDLEPCAKIKIQFTDKPTINQKGY